MHTIIDFLSLIAEIPVKYPTDFPTKGHVLVGT